MFESLNSFVMTYLPQLISFAVMVLLVIAYKSSLRFQFWVTDFAVTFPVMGKLSKLAKDRTQGNDGWLRSEQKLCAAYKPYIQLMSRKDFDNRIEYLGKSSDLGRTPTPLGVWVFLIVLVIMEGLGFSYLLGSWMANEASANTLSLLMVAIVLALCGVMVFITHSAGHQYHRTILLRACFERFKDMGRSEYAINQKTKLKDAQSNDDDEPDFKQVVNRVAKNPDDKGSFGWVICAIVLIVGIGAGSTMMRIQHLKGEEIRQSAVMNQESSNPFAASSLPSAVTDPQHAADNKAAEEAGSAKTLEGYTAFIVLGVIFVFTQFIGIGTGYKYGFVGKESQAAFRGVGGQSTYEDYLGFFQPWRDLVNGRLKDLQQRIEEKANTKLSLVKNFDDYLREERLRVEPDEVVVRAPRPMVAEAKQEGAKSIPVIAAVKPAAADAAKSVEMVQAEMIRLDDPVKEQEYFKALPVLLRGNPELRQWLINRKAARELAADDTGLF
jgi:hypothetical protein